MTDDNSLNLRYYMNGTTNTLKFYDKTLTDDQIEFITTNLPLKCQTLIFRHTKLTDIGINYIAINLLLRGGAESNLTHLCVSGASITDDSVINLCNALSAKNNKLKKLILELNPITVIGAKAIAEMLKMNNQHGCLELLDISYTMIGRDGVYTICQSLENNTKLKTLDISCILTNEERLDKEMNELLEIVNRKLNLLNY